MLSLIGSIHDIEPLLMTMPHNLYKHQSIIKMWGWFKRSKLFACSEKISTFFLGGIEVTTQESIVIFRIFLFTGGINFESLLWYQIKFDPIQEMKKEAKKIRELTKVSPLVGSLGLLKHLVKILFELVVPFHQLVHEDRAQPHSKNMLPGICSNQIKPKESEP